MNLYKKQTGVALITVLFLFALATIIVAGLARLMHNDMRRASLFLESEQAYLLCLSGEEWARQYLADDYLVNQNVDHVNEPWAEDGKILKVDHGYIEISIRDAQGLLNINNLVEGQSINQGAKSSFQRLIDASISDEKLSTTIAEQMADWLDTDSQTGTEEADYLSEDPSYRPPNSPISDVSELRLLKDVDKDVYRQLHQDVLPMLVALPKKTKVNLNTVQSEVLAALAGVDISTADSVVTTIRSNKSGFASTADILNLLPVTAQQSLSAATEIGTSTEYFEVRVRAKFGDQYAYLNSIVFRDPGNDGQLTIVSRDRSMRFIFPFSHDYNQSNVDRNYDIDI